MTITARAFIIHIYVIESQQESIFMEVKNMGKKAGFFGAVIGAAAGIAAYKFIKEKKAECECTCKCEDNCECDCNCADEEETEETCVEKAVVDLDKTNDEE